MATDRTRYAKTVLPSGMRIISESIPTVRSISIGLWVDVGSRDEPSGLDGVTHFIEHMVFKGTHNRSAKEIAAYLESVGGVLNAFTSREQTCFYAKIIDKHLPLAVEIVADLALNGRFDPVDIEKEKNIVVDEINEVHDTPADLVHDLFAQALFGDHPLGRPIMGTARTVRNLQKENILDYLARGYRPDRMVVAASGSLRHQDLVHQVRKHFNSTHSGKADIPPRVRPTMRPGVFVRRRPTNQTHVCLGTTAFRFDHPDRDALVLLNSIIGGGMSSKLFQKVREEMGLAYTIFSFLDFFMDTGVIGVYFSADRKNVPLAISTIFDELAKFGRQKLSRQELASAKEQLKGSFLLGLENTSNRMNRLAKQELLLGRYLGIDETLRAIERVKAEKVRELAAQLFRPERFTVTVLGPVRRQTIEAAIP